MDSIEKTLLALSDLAWGPPMLLLLFLTHLFLTLRLRFIQRYLGRALKLSFSSKLEGDGDISHFGALTTALAATVGTGNIIGVATALAAGGPGAVFWMWCTGIFGIATKYSEALLAIKFRITREDGSMAGGPMYVLERGMHCRWLGAAFALFTAAAAFGIGNMVQANAISTMAQDTFSLNPWITGTGMTLLTAVVILGGIKSIARVCQMFVPLMVALYLVGCLALIIMKLETIPEAIGLILSSAFSGQAATGGFLGATMRQAVRYGVARGLFSNESGLGSAPIVAAAAQTKNPVRQALVSSTGTFWDTVIVCALTGIVLVNSGEWTRGTAAGALTKTAFAELHVFGPMILTLALFTFVFSTILGWSYYGEKAVEYLFGARAARPYRLLWVAAVMLGSLLQMKVVWALADIANALMALPNLISLVILSPIVVSETRKYLWNNALDQE